MYPVTIRLAELEEHVRLNPGTTLVSDALTGQTLWPLPSEDTPFDPAARFVPTPVHPKYVESLSTDPTLEVSGYQDAPGSSPRDRDVPTEAPAPTVLDTEVDSYFEGTWTTLPLSVLGEATRILGKPVALIDIDDVLLDPSERRGHISENGVLKPEPDWAAYHEGAASDKPLKFAHYMRGLQVKYLVVILTARYRSPKALRDFLNAMGLLLDDGAPLLLKFRNRETETGTMAQYKAGIVGILQGLKVPIALAVDDNLEICRAYSDLGVPNIYYRNQDFKGLPL